MPRRRQLSPWYWVMIAAMAVAGVLLVSHFAFDWGPRWLPLAVSGVVLASNIFTFRMLWKQSDHAAFHPREDDVVKRSSIARKNEPDR